MYPEESLAIFICPPSLDTLIDRLTKRKTESPKSLKKRIKRVKEEMTYRDNFDLVLVNDLLEVSIEGSRIYD